ncbi:MAG: MBL fold metallo-hydrolase [Bacteroidota bacterium]
MKITILCENQSGHAGAKVCSAEWGLSFFIQKDDVNILFDTGHTDIYWKNAEQLNIDLQTTDFVVLSHHHWDHVGGLKHHNFKSKKELIIHPEIIDKVPDDSSQKMISDFNIIQSKGSLEFSNDIFYLGEIPRKTTFEKGNYKDEAMRDDSAIAIRTNKGVVVVTGCSHSGICNICEQAKKVTGQKLYAVIGGFHLFENEPEAVEGTIDYFKTEKPRYLYPMHCVDFPTLARFYNEFGIEKLATGDVIKFNDL